jgi:hypothetical protein
MSDENRKLPVGAATANCKRCQKTPVPSNFGSPRKCAFNSNGIFTSDNWNCVTACELRALAGEGWDNKKDAESFFVRRDDRSYAAIWIPPHPEDVPDGERVGPFRGGGFIAMTWYKDRGQTEIMIRVDPRDGGMPDEAGLPLTAHEAEAALENLQLAVRELKL